ncbi:MAG: sodium:solute symporter [Bacteroidetes bacterium]|nr:sodium:solute symporter [Bacteroidota bacterium]
MSWIDWSVLIFTLVLIVVAGIYKGRGQKDLKGYFLGDNSLSWYKVMFSVMATQASAITFLSAPGQAFTDGMRFVQYYLGLPLAMIAVSAILVPAYHRLKVITAYEFLEERFDVNVRVLTAFLFLLQRGLATGLTIYAPALVMSSLLGWNIYLTCAVMGLLVVIYTLSGGAKAVAQTQLHQMIVILAGMLFAGYMIFKLMPDDIGFMETLHLSGKTGKLNALVTKFDLNDKYNLWSGLLGGFFLALSYFGTDQSQVGRYLAGKSIKESTQGLLMNAVVKIPMQFGILFIGVALYVFYIFSPQPIVFNNNLIDKIQKTPYASQYQEKSEQFEILEQQHQTAARTFLHLHNAGDEIGAKLEAEKLKQIEAEKQKIRVSTKSLIQEAIPTADTNDTNYIFLYFVLHNLPIGLIGLLIAVIFSASWSSTSSELNALSGIFVIDFYKRLFKRKESELHYVSISKIATAVWGVIAVLFAFLATQLNSLIEAVNLLGSLFYGTILGVFVTAFIARKLKPKAVLLSAIISELAVIALYNFEVVAFLWLNMIGCILVLLLALIINIFLPKGSKKMS